MPNGYIESFNGKFRDECLNEHWFETLATAGLPAK
jgi:putative transposase